jgi:2-alkenal reductase
MRKIANRQLLIPTVFIIILFVSGCSTIQELASGNLPSVLDSTAEPTPIPPIATVDTSVIAAAVLAEIEPQLEAAGETTAPDPAVADVDKDSIVEEVLGQVEARLAEMTGATPTVLPEAIAADGTVTAGDLENSLIDVYRRANPAVVFIIVPQVGSGSGFVFNIEGHIVTNNHVVGSASVFEVVFAGGERRQAELVGKDVDSDLAVIKVDQLPDGVAPLPLASSGDLRVGQLVVAIGNPFGEQGSMSLGIISGLDRSLPSDRATTSGDAYSLPQVIQTDAPINPGNSGGPLLNLNGEVLGVNSAIATVTGTNSGVGFSIPVGAVKRIVPNLISDGSYGYPYMGAGFDGEVSLDDQSVYGLSQTKGAYVISVTPGTPADEAGLIPADASTGRGGDLIVAIDGRPINDFSDLNGYLVFETSVGQSINITVLRDGEPVELQLTLGARP